MHGPAALIKCPHKSQSKICHLFPSVSPRRLHSSAVDRTVLQCGAFCRHLMLRQRARPQPPSFFPLCLWNLFARQKINYLAWSEEVNERWTVRMCKPTCEDLILTASLLPETNSFSFPTILFVRVFNPFQSEAECFLAASILLQGLAPVFLVLSILFFLSASPPPLWPLPSLFSLPLQDSRELSPFELDPELRLLLSLKQRILFLSHIQMSKLILNFNWHHQFLSVWFSLMSKPTFNQLNCVWPRVIFGQNDSEQLCFFRIFMC